MESKQLTTIAAPTCPLCGHSGEILYMDLRDSLYGVPGTWQMRRCPNTPCGLLWLDPMPTADSLYLAYQNYFTHVAAASARPKTGLKGLLARRGRRLIHRLVGVDREQAAAENYFLAGVPPGRLLEVGCGSGSRLSHLRRLGWRVEGQEVDPAAAEAGRQRGETIHLGALDSLVLPPGQFDVVVMSHVIEHVPDPIDLLAQCRRLLVAGGLLVALTPNSRGLLHHLFGSHYLGLDSPRHLHLFHPSLLANSALRAGFARAECTTTNARLDYMAVASLNIATSGTHPMSERPDPMSYLAAACFQAWAQHCLRDLPDSGEECVLKAWT